MSSFIIRFTYHCLLAAIVFYSTQVHSYVLTESCANHEEDIENGLEDSTHAADTSHSSTTTIFGRNWNYFGMLDSLFPEIGRFPAAQEYINNLYVRTSNFATLEVEGEEMGPAGVAAAWQDRHLNNPPWDNSLVFSCSVAVWERDAGGGHFWYNSEMEWWYNFGEVDEICGAGVSTMLGMNVDIRVDFHFIVVLCPKVLQQTPGQPKMYAALEHTDLQLNDRPEGPYTLGQGQPMTEEATLNVQYWLGMTIDQLRSRTLSVYIGRIMLFITMYTNVNALPGVPIPSYVTPEYSSNDSSVQTFAQVKGLPLDQAVQNLDTLSLYMTGAGVCAIFESIRSREFDIPGLPVWEDYVWDGNGTLTELTGDNLARLLPAQFGPFPWDSFRPPTN